MFWPVWVCVRDSHWNDISPASDIGPASVKRQQQQGKMKEVGVKSKSACKERDKKMKAPQRGGEKGTHRERHSVE